MADALSLCSDDIHQCFTECTSIDTLDNAWQQAITLQHYNSLVPLAEPVSKEAVLELPSESTTSKLEDHQFRLLFQSLSLPNRARILSASSPHASTWLQVVPGLNLHLDPSELQAGIKWWLEGLGLHLDHSQFQVAINGGLAWTFPMVLAAHCSLRLLWTHLAIMLLSAKGVVMWFHATTKYVMSLQSPVGELISGVQVEMGSNVAPNYSHTHPC
ncbi:hypothetical protein EMCRGX_G017229 [Ephydatia muelleri]